MDLKMIQQQCQKHNQDVISYDLDPLAQISDRYLCKKCLTIQSPYRQIQIIEEAKQKFKEMIQADFNNKKNQLTVSFNRFSNAQKQIKEFQEFFNNKINKAVEKLNQRIQEVDCELKKPIEPSHEMQTEQVLINLSNYINYGFNQTINEMNSQQQEFQITQFLDYKLFEEHLENICNQLESLFNLYQIDEQLKLIQPDNSQIDEKKQINLRYKCDLHQSEIIMINLKPGECNQRLLCLYCMQEKIQEQLKTIYDTNKLWQTHINNVFKTNNSLYDQRLNNFNELNKLIIEFQQLNQKFFNEFHKLMINQNNKIIKDRYDLQIPIINKQLFQMELIEIQQVALTLSQQDPMQEISLRHLSILKEDKQSYDQIQEQLNLSRKNLMESQQKISQLFQFKDFVNELNNNFMESFFFDESIPQFYLKYTNFYNKYKIMINFLEKQISLNIQEQNNVQPNQYQKFNKILEQITQIEKNQLKQINLSTENLHITNKYQVKRSLTNLSINKVNFYSIKLSQFQKITLQFKPLIQDQPQIQQVPIVFQQYIPIIYQFSYNLKHPYIQLSQNNKIATNTIIDQSFICLCDQPILQNKSFTVNFKINRLIGIMIGICKRQFIQQHNFEFRYYANSTGHGCYVLDHQGNVYSHHDQSKNFQKLGFIFKEGDIINVEVNQQTKYIVWKMKNFKYYAMEFEPSEDLHFCCALYSTAQVEIV